MCAAGTAGVARAEQEESLLLATTTELRREIAVNNWHGASVRAAENEAEVLSRREVLRSTIVADTASGELTVPESTDCLEAVRWTVRVSHHLARITHHMERATNAAGKDTA